MIGTIPVCRIGAIWNKGRHVYVFQCPTDHATAVTQVTIVVHVVTHTSTYMVPHIPNIKNIGAVLDIYPEENNLKALTHQRHGNDPWTRVGDGSIPITNRDWNSCFLNNEENKKLFSFSSTHISKAGVGRMQLLSIHFETKQCDLTRPQHCNHS